MSSLPIAQLLVEPLEAKNTTNIAAYVAVPRKVSELFVCTPTTRKKPNRVTATATVIRLFVLSAWKLIMIEGAKIQRLLAKDTMIPVRTLTVIDGHFASRPGTPCISNLYASGLISLSALDQDQERGITERM
jgi:hypothetical protein